MRAARSVCWHPAQITGGGCSTVQFIGSLPAAASHTCSRIMAFAQNPKWVAKPNYRRKRLCLCECVRVSTSDVSTRYCSSPYQKTLPRATSDTFLSTSSKISSEGGAEPTAEAFLFLLVFRGNTKQATNIQSQSSVKGRYSPDSQVAPSLSGAPESSGSTRRARRQSQSSSSGMAGRLLIASRALRTTPAFCYALSLSLSHTLSHILTHSHTSLPWHT